MTTSWTERVDLSKLLDIIDAECTRQKVDDAARWRLAVAYRYLIDYLTEIEYLTEPIGLKITEHDLCVLATLVDPRNIKGYRKIPVTFDGGGSAVSAELIPDLMPAAIEALNEFGDADSIRNILDIHPWEDGNGRVAWLLWCWCTGNLEPLPDFYSEK